MSRADFDTLTDWIGIPISVFLLLLLVLTDLRLTSNERSVGRLAPVVALVMVASIALIVARFIRLA